MTHGASSNLIPTAIARSADPNEVHTEEAIAHHDRHPHRSPSQRFTVPLNRAGHSRHNAIGIEHPLQEATGGRESDTGTRNAVQRSPCCPGVNADSP